MHRITSLAVAAALVLAACSGTNAADPAPPDSASTPDSTGEAPTDTAADGTDTDALVAEVLAMSADEQLAYAAELSVDYQRQVSKLSGLEEELGGPDAADAALAAAWAPLIEQLQATLEQPIQLGFVATAQPARPVNGAGLFAIIVTAFMGGEGAVTATNNLAPGDVPAPGGDQTYKVSGSQTEGKLDVTVSSTEGGSTSSLTMQLKIAPCPDADGKFKVDATAETSVRSGSFGQTDNLQLTAEGTVDDNAELVSVSTEYRMQTASFGGGASDFVDISGGTGRGASVNRQSSKVSSEFIDDAIRTAAILSAMEASALANAAAVGWKSGRCVRLDTTAAPGPTGLDPGATSDITASPRSKIDGKPTGGTVTAKLASGAKSVDPAGAKVPADAKFTYTAPDEKGKSGVVELEARSKRGIGRAQIAFNTKGAGYTATFTGDGLTISGTVGDLAVAFDLDGTFEGGTATFSHAPTDDRGGTVTVSGGGNGATLTGGGTYVITDNGDDTLTLTETISSCVDVSGVCRDAVHPVLLTPE